MEDLACAPDRHPEPATGIDCQSVWIAACDLGERAAVGDSACRRVEVENVYPALRRVDVVHQPAVWTPAQTIGDADTGDHQLDLAVCVEPVQSACASSHVECHRAGPEAPRGVRLAVVHPIAS